MYVLALISIFMDAHVGELYPLAQFKETVVRALESYRDTEDFLFTRSRPCEGEGTMTRV